MELVPEVKARSAAEAKATAPYGCQVQGQGESLPAMLGALSCQCVSAWARDLAWVALWAKGDGAAEGSAGLRDDDGNNGFNII